MIQHSIKTSRLMYINPMPIVGTGHRYIDPHHEGTIFNQNDLKSC